MKSPQGPLSDMSILDVKAENGSDAHCFWTLRSRPKKKSVLTAKFV